MDLMLEQQTAAARAAQARQAYQVGIRAKGFAITTVAGQLTQNLNLSGLAGELLGIGIVNPTANEQISFAVNNDLVLDRVNGLALEIAPGAGNPRSFYEIPRPLNGSDTLELTIVDTAPTVISVVLWYRGKPIQ